jgi:hypothetical protein
MMDTGICSECGNDIVHVDPRCMLCGLEVLGDDGAYSVENDGDDQTYPDVHAALRAHHKTERHQEARAANFFYERHRRLPQTTAEKAEGHRVRDIRDARGWAMKQFGMTADQVEDLRTGNA